MNQDCAVGSSTILLDYFKHIDLTNVLGNYKLIWDSPITWVRPNARCARVFRPWFEGRLAGRARSPPYCGHAVAYPPARPGASPPAGFIQPCQPILVVHPPVGPGWLHEVKHDGYRLLARKDADRVTFWTRYGTDFTDRLRGIADAVRALPADNALIDGEAVVFARTAIPTLPRCAPRRAASKPHLSPSTFSASRATISASGLWRSGERRSRGWSRRRRHPVQRSARDRGRDRVRPCLQAGPGGDRVEARRQPLSQRAEPQLAEAPEPGVSTPVSSQFRNFMALHVLVSTSLDDPLDEISRLPFWGLPQVLPGPFGRRPVDFLRSEFWSCA